MRIREDLREAGGSTHLRSPLKITSPLCWRYLVRTGSRSCKSQYGYGDVQNSANLLPLLSLLLGVSAPPPPFPPRGVSSGTESLKVPSAMYVFQRDTSSCRCCCCCWDGAEADAEESVVLRKVVGSERRERVSLKSVGRTSETNQGMSLGLWASGIMIHVWVSRGGWWWKSRLRTGRRLRRRAVCMLRGSRRIPYR